MSAKTQGTSRVYSRTPVAAAEPSAPNKAAESRGQVFDSSLDQRPVPLIFLLAALRRKTAGAAEPPQGGVHQGLTAETKNAAETADLAIIVAKPTKKSASLPLIPLLPKTVKGPALLRAPSL